MKKADKKKWVKALRSGEYEQGKGSLCKEKDGETKWCCLGVAVDILHEGDWKVRKGRWRMEGDGGMPTPAICEALGIPDDIAEGLAGKNDNGQSFKQLASWIERSKKL